jgi:hypothetical protein
MCFTFISLKIIDSKQNPDYKKLYKIHDPVSSSTMTKMARKKAEKRRICKSKTSVIYQPTSVYRLYMTLNSN